MRHQKPGIRGKPRSLSVQLLQSTCRNRTFHVSISITVHAAIRASISIVVHAAIRASISIAVRASIRASISITVHAAIRAAIRTSISITVHAAIRASILLFRFRAHEYQPVQDPCRDRIRAQAVQLSETVDFLFLHGPLEHGHASGVLALELGGKLLDLDKSFVLFQGGRH